MMTETILAVIAEKLMGLPDLAMGMLVDNITVGKILNSMNENSESYSDMNFYLSMMERGHDSPDFSANHLTPADSLVHHSNKGSQCVSIKNAQCLPEAGIEPSVGYNYDNALADTKGYTRQKSSAFLGASSKPWDSKYLHGSTGSTTAACSGPSATSRHSKLSKTVTPHRT
jgi:hypothetical protein